MRRATLFRDGQKVFMRGDGGAVEVKIISTSVLKPTTERKVRRTVYWVGMTSEPFTEKAATQSELFANAEDVTS